MGKDPKTIERQIEETRARLGERVDALSYKADVPSRIGDKLTETRDSAGSKLGELASRVSDGTPGAENLRLRTRSAAGWMHGNPLALAAGAVAAGVLIGLLLPSTRVEDDKLGEAADEVRSRAAETGREALDRGRQVAEDAAEAARESGSRHADELGQSARQKAAEAAEQARSGADDPGQPA
jgi:ElaB/YqjD/DUF883 family membrane-anchored ribosome-binding protein